MKALIIVDLQNDFMPGGALAVKCGDETVRVANRIMKKFDFVIATQDWHPPDHKSFAVSHPGGKIGDIAELNGISQILWPVHCVQNTPGALFHTDLKVDLIKKVIRKGTNREIDSYSGFYDNDHKTSTGLEAYLKAAGVSKVYIMGLATDYCVKYTAIDAVKSGFKVHLVADGCRGVELQPGDVEKAIRQMSELGIFTVSSETLLAV